MEWNAFIDWFMKAVLGAIMLHGVQIMSGMEKSIDQLNSKMAKIIERTEWHSREIDRLDNRISDFENTRRPNGRNIIQSDQGS